MSSFARGPYTVVLLKKPGPGCSLYAVFLGKVKIGQCISLPSESDCAWLERQQREQTGYAYSTTPLPTWLRARRKWKNPPGSNANCWEKRSKRGVYRRGGGPKTKEDLASELAEAIES